MRILLVSEDLPAKVVGGLGKHVVTLGNALIAAGHSVAIMGHNGIAYNECADEIGFRGRFIAGFADPIGGWKERQMGFFNPWKRPWFARQLARAILLHAKQFEVVHYHGHLPMIGRYIPETVRFVQTRHDQGGDCITNVRFKNGDVCREREASACAACIHAKPGLIRTALSTLAVQRYRQEVVQAYARHPVIFVSDFLRRNFTATLPAADLSKTQVIHNFVDEKVLQASPALSTPSAHRDSVRIHISGRIDASKGIVALLELLTPKLPLHWHVHIYGDGPLRPSIEATHVGRAVTFHGHQLYRETISATRAATVVVVPSTWEEPCGTVILEALRIGKVCYALARGGTPELSRYGADGQLRLFESLPELVAALLAERTFADQCGGASADVSAAIPALLAVYATNATRPPHLKSS